MADNPNLQALKAAYQAWIDSRGTRTGGWLEVVHADVAMASLAAGKEGPGIRPLEHGTNAVMQYLDDVMAHWTMQGFRIERYIVEGEAVVAIVDCAWTNKGTGKTYQGRMAHYWTFRDGKIASFEEFLDTADLIAAATA